MYDQPCDTEEIKRFLWLSELLRALHSCALGSGATRGCIIELGTGWV